MILKKLFNNIKQLIKRKISLKTFAEDISSYYLNYFKFQRCWRRSFFSIGEVEFGLMMEKDLPKYQEFLKEYSSLDNAFNLTQDPTREDRLHFIAKYKSRIVASGHLVRRFVSRDKEFWELSGLLVSRKYQGLGIATKLAQTIIKSFQPRNRIIFLNVEKNNYRAINLYKKINFKENEDFCADLIRNMPSICCDALKLFYSN